MIEVGIDVPNATVMVVEDADRFGLLQLHQLRGRIGRGEHASWCYLLADPSTPEGQARLEAMRDSVRRLRAGGARPRDPRRRRGLRRAPVGVQRPQARAAPARRSGRRSRRVRVAEQILDDDPDLDRASRSSARRSRTCSATRSSSSSRAERCRRFASLRFASATATEEAQQPPRRTVLIIDRPSRDVQKRPNQPGPSFFVDVERPRLASRRASRRGRSVRRRPVRRRSCLRASPRRTRGSAPSRTCSSVRSPLAALSTSERPMSPIREPAVPGASTRRVSGRPSRRAA